jgi:hypothetical protein
LIDRGFKTTEIEELQKKVSEWQNSERPYPIPHILEDHTIYLIIETIYYSRLVKCNECKEAKKCLEAGKNWVSGLLTSYVNALPESDLKRFWKSIRVGVPEIKTDLAYKYFAPRLMLDKDHNPIRFLKMFEEFKMLPYFYSKAIPRSIDLLAYDLLKLMKHFSLTYKKTKKLIE